jgi:hypothetical protein
MGFTRVPGFLPSTSGFHFVNNYQKGTNYPVVSLPIVGTIVAGDAGNGLCGGFVLAALDLFCHNPRFHPPPNGVANQPPAGSPIFNYLVGRLLDSFGPVNNSNAAKVIEWIHRPGHDVTVSAFGAGLARRVVQVEWPRIKADIDSGVPSPLNLIGELERGLADVSGHIETLHHCHQVLAYAYEVDTSNNLTILVYDCNDPNNDDSRISLNIGSDPSHTIPIAAPAINTAMSGGITVRGFFRSDYALHGPSEIAGTQWQDIGHANNVVAMTALTNKLFCATSDNQLWARDPVLSNVNWQAIGHANNVVAMAALEGRLFCATKDNRIWARDPVLSNVNWQDIGEADNIVAMAAMHGRIFAATKDNKFWGRNPTLSNVAWRELGRAHDVVGLAALSDKFFCATKGNRLLAGDPVL